nr:MAG TPA: hypothetical protein [Caudoviricetes sp.]
MRELLAEAESALAFLFYSLFVITLPAPLTVTQPPR